MSGELKYHYSNPKFEGLPWPANQQQPIKTQVKKFRPTCVKKPYETEQQVANEVAKLALEEHRDFFERLVGWDYEFCAECQAWHVVRI